MKVSLKNGTTVSFSFDEVEAIDAFDVPEDFEESCNCDWCTDDDIPEFDIGDVVLWVPELGEPSEAIVIGKRGEGDVYVDLSEPYEFDKDASEKYIILDLSDKCWVPASTDELELI